MIRLANRTPGPAVDVAGYPVQDPTENVKALNAAEAKRQDDLRLADGRRQDELRRSEAAHIREVLQLRAHHYEELRRRDSKHDDERRRIDAMHARELREAESDRLDALREGDQAQIARAAEVQATQQAATQQQVTTTAEALRADAEARERAGRTALADAVRPLAEAIADLRRNQYEQAGQRAQVVESGVGNRAWLGLAIAGAGCAIAFAGFWATVILAVVGYLVVKL